MYVERRIMYFDVPIKDIISSVLPMKDWSKVIENNLPEGTKILNVHADNRKGVFEFLIHHPDFEEVPIGCEAKRFVFTMQMREFRDWRTGLVSAGKPTGKLHNHPKLEEALGLEKDGHVVVDRKDWEKVLNFVEE